MSEKLQVYQDNDPTAETRKADHIELAFQSVVGVESLDQRFYYEPMLAGHPGPDSLPERTFLGKTFRAPIWVSSMTGGTAMAKIINENIARACGEFGFGMGLGSCRQLLYSDERLADFAVRPLMGPQAALYANLGIAQVEQLFASKEWYLIDRLLEKLQADGLIVHVNPLQEWLQPEGDNINTAPLHTIEKLLEYAPYPIIVKEVGQGMGKNSLQALLQLPLAAVEFSASGGTNFSKLELLRDHPTRQAIYMALANVGHSAEEMVGFVNEIQLELGDKIRCQEVIISGGVRDFLDGYYLLEKCNLNCVYGQASAFLKHARNSYEELHQFVETQIRGLEVAQQFLRVR